MGEVHNLGLDIWIQTDENVTSVSKVSVIFYIFVLKKTTNR